MKLGRATPANTQCIKSALGSPRSLAFRIALYLLPHSPSFYSSILRDLFIMAHSAQLKTDSCPLHPIRHCGEDCAFTSERGNHLHQPLCTRAPQPSSPPSSAHPIWTARLGGGISRIENNDGSDIDQKKMETKACSSRPHIQPLRDSRRL